jgi:hypothetical protein
MITWLVTFLSFCKKNFNTREPSKTGIELEERSFACKHVRIVKIKCSKDDARVHMLAHLFMANGISLEKIYVRHSGSACESYLLFICSLHTLSFISLPRSWKDKCGQMDMLSDYSVLLSGQKATPFTHPLSDFCTRSSWPAVHERSCQAWTGLLEGVTVKHLAYVINKHLIGKKLTMISVWCWLCFQSHNISVGILLGGK